MAIHGPLYWKQIAKDLREINNNLVDELSRTRDEKRRAAEKLYDQERAKYRIEDELSNMCTIGWRIEAILHCLSGVEYVYAVDILKEVQERLERERDKTNVKCE